MWPELHDLTVHAVLFGFITMEQRRKVIEPFIERAKRQQQAGQHALETYGKEMDAFSLMTIKWGIEMIKINLVFFNSLLEAD